MAEINSIDDLKKTTAPVEKEEPEVKEEVVNKTAEQNNPYLQAALDRAEAAEKEQEDLKNAEKNNERKNDGRTYEYEVEGFNIGDSLMRRFNTLNNNAESLSEKLNEEDIEREVSDDDRLNEETSLEDDLNGAFENPEDDPMFADDKVVPIKKEATANTSKEIENPELFTATDDLATLEDMNIDDEDLLDLDLDEDEDSDSEDDELTEKELEGLREAIKERLEVKAPVQQDGSVNVSKKAVSLTQVLARQKQDVNTVDYPLMSAGRCVSMRAFSGTEIESLNRGASGRNRFNTLRDIYHTIYDHIVTPNKPEFDQWLKVTSFMDIEHLYMAAYKASFLNANYIPFTCENDQCNHIFLSDDIAIEDMIKFKDADAKKRFYDILENTDTQSKEDACLYETKIVPISSTIAIGFREPSIYNTIFENSILDQKFIDKYTRLLTIMVYIDNIYLIDNGSYSPVYCKKDANSIAKTTKYRIATFSKIIGNLSSDEYNNILAEITNINNLGDEVTYQLPEITCPKCGQTIAAQDQQATQLLFSRHQLSLLSQES